MSEDWFVKKPCQHCPFRRDVTPFLTTARAEEISGLAWNQYNSFPCHKTLEYDDDDGEAYGGKNGNDPLECAGFLAMQIEAGAPHPEGFAIPENTYLDSDEMVEAYEWENTSRAEPRT